jgi:hypothetical protein
MADIHELTKQQAGTFYTISFEFLNDRSKKRYTYKVENETYVEVGDLVVVETVTGYKLGCAKEVHASPKIDYKAPYEYKWIVGAISPEKFLEQRHKEHRQIKELKKTDKQKSRV